MMRRFLYSNSTGPCLATRARRHSSGVSIADYALYQTAFPQAPSSHPKRQRKQPPTKRTPSAVPSSRIPTHPHQSVRLGPQKVFERRAQSSGGEEGEEDYFADDDDFAAASPPQQPKESPQEMAETGPAEEAPPLPVINPFTHRVAHRHTAAISHLLANGFEINASNVLVPSKGFSLASMNIGAVRNAKVKALLQEYSRLPDGDALLRHRCLHAKEVVAGTFVPPKLVPIPDPILQDLAMTPDQQNFISLARRGLSLYIGGSAGTGKTILLKAIQKELALMGVRVAMTATTGVSSVHLGGNTFHSAFGVPYGDKGKWDAAALRVIDAIVIDEVSLLSKRLLEEFSRAAQVARLSSAPFGGIQLILCGDFLQLSHEDSSGAHDPCYASPLFRHFVALQLVTPLRHKEGDPLLGLLRRLRVGEYDPMVQTLRNEPPPEANPIYIFPKRRSVVTVNAMRLSSLDTEQLLFTPQCGPTHLFGSFTQSLQCRIPRHDRAALVRALLAAVRAAFPASRATELDVVVMPTRGAEDQFCLRLRNAKSTSLYEHVPPTPRAAWNTAVREVVAAFGGTVEEAHHDGEPDGILPYSVSLSGNMAYASESILHLKVGCQVMVNRNLSRTVANGALGTIEAFAPLSHALLPQRQAAGSGAGAGSTYAASSWSAGGFDRLKTFARLPLVRLQTGELVQIPPCAEPVGGGPDTYYYGHNLFTLPLQLGYAFTVHKVQGLTIDGPVVVNCDDYFHCPHLIYVACSRVRRLEQLTVRGVGPSEVSVSPNSLAFAQSLAPATEEPIITEDHCVADWHARAAARGEVHEGGPLGGVPDVHGRGGEAEADDDDAYLDD